MRTLGIVAAVIAGFVFGLMCGSFIGSREHRRFPASGPAKAPLMVRHEEYKKIIQAGTLKDHIMSIEGKDASRWGTDMENPLARVTDRGVEMFAKRGIDIRKMAGFKTVLITGNYCGANSIDLVNTDPEVLLVIGEDFTTHGDLFSLGPVVAMANSHFMGKIISTSLVWCIDESFPRDLTIGFPLVLSDTAETSQIETITKEVWRGDYGLRIGMADKAMNADR